MTPRTGVHIMTTRTKVSSGIFLAAVAAAVLSAVAMGMAGRWEAVLRFVVVAGIMVLARRAKVPVGFAAAFAVLILLAMWGSVQHWYRAPGEVDSLVHFLTPGSLAAVCYFLLVQARLLPDARDPSLQTRSWAPIVWVGTTGTTAAVVWEYYEWAVEQLNPEGMIVGYTDTVIDILAGMAGSIVAGALVVWWAQRSRTAGAGTAPRSENT